MLGKLKIDLLRLGENYKRAQDLAPNSIVAPVLKNNAYGLGFKQIGTHLYKNERCQNFFVDYVTEAVKLRPSVPGANIFILQGLQEHEIPLIKGYNLIPVISTLSEYKVWKKNKLSHIRPILNVETGLSRLGFREKDLKELTDTDKKDFGMCMSHLSCADIPNHPMNYQQLKRIKAVQEVMGGIPITLSASGGVMLDKDFHCKMVRVGNMIYGLKQHLYNNKPVVSVEVPVLQIADIKKGDTVGYRANFSCSRDGKIAVLGIGFGDGVPRSFSKNGFFYFGEHKAPVLGTLCMDCTVVDVTDIENVCEDDMATLINDTHTIDEMAEATDMLPSELLSNIGNSKRFIREYISKRG